MKSSKYNNKNHTTCLTSSTSTSFALLRYVALLSRWEFNLVLIGGIRFVVCGRLLLWSDTLHLPLPNTLMLLFEFVYYEYRGNLRLLAWSPVYFKLAFFRWTNFCLWIVLVCNVCTISSNCKSCLIFLPAKLYELQLFFVGVFSWQIFFKPVFSQQ